MGEPLTAEYVSKVFGNLTREGGETAFMNHVVEDVSWTVKGTHPLAGHYSSKKAFKESAYNRVQAGLQTAMTFRLTSILVSNDWAVVEMYVDNAIAGGGWIYDNNYCCVCRFRKGRIVEMRAYMDSVMVTQLINEAEGKAA